MLRLAAIVFVSRVWRGLQCSLTRVYYNVVSLNGALAMLTTTQLYSNVQVVGTPPAPTHPAASVCTQGLLCCLMPAGCRVQ